MNLGGVETAIALLSNAFVSRNHEVELILALSGEIKYEIDSRIKVTYLTSFLSDHHQARYNILQRILCRVVSTLCLIEKMRKLGNCIIISSRNEYSTLLSRFGNKTQMRIAQLHHDHKFDKRLIRDFKYHYRYIDYFVHLNEETKDEIESFFFKFNKITKHVVIPHFLSDEIYQTNVSKENIIIAVGRLSREKAFHKLLNIWRQVCNTAHDWKLIIVGDGNERKDLERLCTDLQLNEKIEFKGMLLYDKTLELMQRSKIYAMTSMSEMLPMVLIEAMRCSLPVVAFDVRVGPRSVVKNNKTGFLVENDDFNEYVEKLVMLMTDVDLLHKMSMAAYNQSMCYTESYIMRKWEKIIQGE
jgi:N-acetylglucosaminyldiphosphoundecaprenol N-acetyl-beta-D-mannosaminyltransferase